MSPSDHTHVLLATLGGQPQIITFTLDLLLQRHIPISEVNVVHPAATPDSRMHSSVERLIAEFPGDRYVVDGRIIRLRRHVLRHYGQPLEDIIDETSADGALNTVHTLIRSLKERKCTVHFSITGGRRLVSFLSISAAISSFDHADRIWHIYTPDAVQQRAREEKQMHVAPEDGIRLIEVPFARLSQSLLPRIIETRTEGQTHREPLESGEYERCRQVEQNLTRRAIEILQSFAQGRNPGEVAEELGISSSTVSTYTTKILDECRTAWEMPDAQPLRYYFLREKFRTYFGFA